MRIDYVADAASIPDFVRRIYPFERDAEFRWSMKEENGHEYLLIYWGGALPGHWGLDIVTDHLLNPWSF